MKTHLLGIRHHGPGSAKNVLEYLEQLQPDCILIELPEQCNARLQEAGHPDFRPPVALLLYNPKDFNQAGFYPFAEFSPEWQALLYANAQKITVRAIDLPFLFSPSGQTSHLFTHLDTHLDEAHHADAEMRDPFDAIARFDGYTDSERWWEARIERQAGDVAATFQVIAELMTTLRATKTIAETPETLMREAYMRQCMRQAISDGYQRIAVVCGAWHVPALSLEKPFTATSDAAVLKGRAKYKAEATWVPWTSHSLTVQSGYGAGVRTPVWYQYLFEHGQTSATSYWITEAVRLLRSLEMQVSSAHAIEAIRLADMLAQMRQTAVPGIEELTEAAISVLCQGSNAAFKPVLDKLVIGDKIGIIPEGLNKTPLKTDFEKRLSSAYLKLNSTSTQLALDLRNETHVKKSILLHQMQLLGIEWGQLVQENAQNRTGTFHEDWQLQWLPQFEIKLIEKGTYGATIATATHNISLNLIAKTNNLPELVGLLGTIIKADLIPLLPHVSAQLKLQSVNTTDTVLLATAVLPLAEIQRYGTARALNLASIQPVLDDMLERVCVQMPHACLHINEEQGQTVMKAMLGINRAVHLPGQHMHLAEWLSALKQIAKGDGTEPQCQGVANRLLYDMGELSVQEIEITLAQVVSKGHEVLYSALWLDGFLQGSALMIIHHKPFFQILHHWVVEIENDAFEAMLPVLRRAFSAFAEPERAQILSMARNVLTTEPLIELAPETFEQAQAELDKKDYEWLF